MILLITFILIIILKALTDALFYRKKKRLSKWVEEAWLIMFILIAWNHNRQSNNEYIHVIMFYLFMRAAIFDTLFNIFAKMPVLYKGTTSEWDDFTRRLKTWQYITLKLFLGGIGILIYIKTLM